VTTSVIDLHSHTNCSDGSAAPAELVRLAASAGASAVAITDHDTVAGLAQGRAAADEAGIEFVAGVEISADFQPGTMHILGYFIDESSVELNRTLQQLRHARQQRNPQIATRLQDLGLDVPYDEVASLAGNEVVGRPHFARLMVQKGYVTTIKEAFDRFLAKGAPAYVEKQRLSPADSIDLIHQAGGVAVLAHPYQLKLNDQDTEAQIECLKDLRLDGIEAIYSRLSPPERDSYVRLARRMGLLVTGGSDFHGSFKPDISLVTGLGDLEVPYDLLAEMKAAAAARSRPAGIAPESRPM
jgi:predicted metal-dependent phosphoesterase TrpH